jgi:GT2 family glycosyltransferase
MTQTRLSIAVGVATAGRPELLTFTVETLNRQSRPADAVFVCAPTEADIAGLPRAASEVRVRLGPRGLTRQRNEILRQADPFDIILFIDDDFFCSPNYIAAIEQAFSADQDVVMATGSLIADGILGPGITIEDALSAVNAVARDTISAPGTMAEVYSGYGCNMAIRVTPVRSHGLQFDERLPLYGWLEDLDFSRQIARFGRVVHVVNAYGVHLGIKRGRQPGTYLGYSQIANPIYLYRKGTCARDRALRLISRNLAANFVKSLWPEPYIDRAGRLRGNVRALCDLMRGRLDPERAPLADAIGA